MSTELDEIAKRSEGLTNLCPEYLRAGIRHLQRNCDMECFVHGDDWEACEQPDRYDGERIAKALADIPWLLAEVERLTTANDRLAKIASSVAVALEQGKRDLMAHGWETATAEWLTRGDLYWLKEQGEDPLTYNPFRGEPEGLEP